MEDTALQEDYSQIKPWQFKKGQSGNPSGKPKWAVSLKTWAKKYIQSLSDEEKLEFMEWLNKIDIWKMAEWMPETKSDITSGGKPIPIYNPYAVRADNSNNESSTPNEEN